MLVSRFGMRVVLFTSEPRPSLLLLMACIDQAAVFVTGDTGLTYLVVASKEVYPEESNEYTFRNTTKVIALFGGTHPGLFSYDKLSVIVGRGFKKQTRLVPLGLLHRATACIETIDLLYIEDGFSRKDCTCCQ